MLWARSTLLATASCCSHISEKPTIEYVTDFRARVMKCFSFYRKGLIDLCSLRECSAPRSPRNKSSVAMPIRRCSPTAR